MNKSYYIKDRFAEKAKERQIRHSGTAPGKPKTLPENFPEQTGEARDQAAKTVGWSGRTAEKAKGILHPIFRRRSRSAYHRDGV